MWTKSVVKCYKLKCDSRCFFQTTLLYTFLIKYKEIYSNVQKNFALEKFTEVLDEHCEDFIMCDLERNIYESKLNFKKN